MKDNWKVKKLAEVAILGSGNSAPQKKELFEEGKYPFFRTSDIGQIHIGEIENSRDYLNDKGIKGLKLYPKKTLLIPKSGASTFLNHRVVLAVDGYVSSHLATIKANEDILDNRFLFHFMTTIDSKNLIQDIAYPSLKVSDIGKINIEFPPLAEQQRIVAILDEAFAAIDKAKENAEKNLQNARELFDSYLQSVFANPGDDWEEKPLNEISEVKDGTHDSPKYVKEGIPFVTQKNVTENGLSLTNTKFITEIDHEKFYKRSNVAYGDILISMIGANRGMACIVDDDTTFSIKNVGLVKSNERIDQNYLLYFLKSPKAKNFVKSNSKGGAQEFIGLTQLRKFPIIFAPLSEQKKIVEKLDALSAETNKLENIYQQKIDDLAELKKSILNKAFNGELTANNQVSNVISFPVRVPNISTTDLQAGIVATAFQRHQESGKVLTFGHVKAEKIVHLAQSVLEIELDREPVKDAAGPNDFPRLKKVESRAEKAGFFRTVKNGYGYSYIQGNQFNNLIEKTKNALDDKFAELTNLIDLFVPLDTQQAELVATVYAAWNNLLIDKQPITDEAIVTEARENWHTAKLNIPRERFFNAINWVKENSLIPDGKGKKVSSKK